MFATSAGGHTSSGTKLYVGNLPTDITKEVLILCHALLRLNIFKFNSTGIYIYIYFHITPALKCFFVCGHLLQLLFILFF